MTDREKLADLLEATTYEALGGSLVVKGFATAKEFADHLIANGVRIVVCCNNCVNHGHCIPEDTFRLVGMEKPYCAAGKERSDPQ